MMATRNAKTTKPKSAPTRAGAMALIATMAAMTPPKPAKSIATSSAMTMTRNAKITKSTSAPTTAGATAQLATMAAMTPPKPVKPLNRPNVRLMSAKTIIRPLSNATQMVQHPKKRAPTNVLMVPVGMQIIA